MNKNNLIKLLTSIIICEVSGVIGSIFTTPQISGWYSTLNKPSFNPPSWIFAPVWTTIFVLMGVALYLVWSRKFSVKNELKFNLSTSLRMGHKKSINSLSKKFFNGKWEKLNIILIFIAQLVLNILWSIVFFGMHSPSIAFFVLLMLWCAIAFTIINFYRVSKTSAWLLLPYILWVSFAGILNFFIWILN